MLKWFKKADKFAYTRPPVRELCESTLQAGRWWGKLEFNGPAWNQEERCTIKVIDSFTHLEIEIERKQGYGTLGYETKIKDSWFSIYGFNSYEKYLLNEYFSTLAEKLVKMELEKRNKEAAQDAMIARGDLTARYSFQALEEKKKGMLAHGIVG